MVCLFCQRIEFLGMFYLFDVVFQVIYIVYDQPL